MIVRLRRMKWTLFRLFWAHIVGVCGWRNHADIARQSCKRRKGKQWMHWCNADGCGKKCGRFLDVAVIEPDQGHLLPILCVATCKPKTFIRLFRISLFCDLLVASAGVCKCPPPRHLEYSLQTRPIVAGKQCRTEGSRGLPLRRRKFCERPRYRSHIWVLRHDNADDTFKLFSSHLIYIIYRPTDIFSLLYIS